MKDKIDTLKKFESNVVLEGNQTVIVFLSLDVVFESNVVLEGNQTLNPFSSKPIVFESNVVLEGN